VLNIGGEEVQATETHPFQVVGQGMTAAGNLKVGDQIERKSGESAEVESIALKVGSFPVYNLEVADAHTYFVGQLGLLVHNKCRPPTTFLSGVTIKSHGKVIGTGNVDLRETLDDISLGKLKARDVFKNREGLLPQKPVGYYEEFLHPTPWVKDAGPQRIIKGKGGELYYTADHYDSFVPLN